jgi:hypothetical protein
MRKTILLTLWLLAPVLLLAFHYGPGQGYVARGRAAEKIAEALQFEQAGDWLGAREAYSEALAALTAGDVAVRFKLRLAQANARMYSGELPEAITDLESLLTEMQKQKADPKQLRDVRGTLGTAEYYAAWLMRLEGATAEEWTVPVENARQHFRLLAEEAEKSDAKLAVDYQKNLESTIRLARMDLSELQGLPLSKFCQGCKNVSQKCRSQREGKCQNPGEDEKKPKDARGAGMGGRRGSGS